MGISKMVKTNYKTHAVDHPHDIDIVEKLMKFEIDT